MKYLTIVLSLISLLYVAYQLDMRTKIPHFTQEQMIQICIEEEIPLD